MVGFVGHQLIVSYVKDAHAAAIAYDTSGKRVWYRTIGPPYLVQDWPHAVTPKAVFVERARPTIGVEALDPLTGAVLWSHTIANVQRLAQANGVLYVLTYGLGQPVKIVALNASTGALIGVIGLSSGYYAFPEPNDLMVANGMIFIRAMGPGNVQQAVRRTGYADFWELYKRNVLPRETKNYVPIILAFTVMAKNPAQYGLDKVEPALPLEMDTVRINYPVDLRLVAECVDSDLNTLTELNPSLLRLTTPRDSTYDLRLPGGSKDKFERAMAAIPLDKRVVWRYHHIAPGDTLESVARHYHASPSSIKEVNNLQGEELHADGKILIPVTGGRVAESTKVAYSRKPTRYRVRRGDTVLSVADDFGVPADRLRRWNRLKGDQLAHGAMLVIYRPVFSRQETVINSPSRHSRSHSSKRKSTQSASASTPKNSAQTAFQSSKKSTGAKNQPASGSNVASERASAGLR